MALPSAEHAAGLARQATRDALAAWRLTHVEETAVLLVSALVTNAVRHAQGSFSLALQLRAGRTRLRIEVQDADPRAGVVILDLELGEYLRRTIFNFEKHRRIEHYRLITERTGAKTDV